MLVWLHPGCHIILHFYLWLLTDQHAHSICSPVFQKFWQNIVSAWKMFFLLKSIIAKDCGGGLGWGGGAAWKIPRKEEVQDLPENQSKEQRRPCDQGSFHFFLGYTQSCHRKWDKENRIIQRDVTRCWSSHLTRQTNWEERRKEEKWRKVTVTWCGKYFILHWVRYKVYLFDYSVWHSVIPCTLTLYWSWPQFSQLIIKKIYELCWENF